MSATARFTRLLRFFFSALLLADFGGSLTCFAGTPLVKTQVPGYYRLMVGDAEVTALYDGYIDLDAALLKNVSEQEVQLLLARMFVQGHKVQTAVNAYLVNTGKQLVLVDAGAAKKFGPSLGHIIDNLKAAGYEPSQVDAVLATHLHGDHVNGLISAEGRPVFPNAEIWVAQAESDFWLGTDALVKAPESAKAFFQMAQDAAAPYLKAGKWKTFRADGEILPGIRSLALPGHTPGHSGYRLDSQGQSLLIWGDIVHSHAVQFMRPEVVIEFDVDKKTAAATRKNIFAETAKEKTMVAGAHLPFPGIGHVRAERQGYAWVPIEFGPIRP